MDAISGRSAQADLANQRAYLDVTTRLPSFRTFKPLLSTSLARCQERGQPLSLLAVSIDHLAQLAARHGPAGRDEVLRETAAILKARLGEHDIIARTGPDEFLIALPGASARQATALAEALRAAVEQHAYRLPGEV